MNYTREPIIETVITPKEGYRLLVKNSKAAGVEEYFVEALEIVSFGNAIFYRSTERPKSFLLPTSDYEIIELKEAKVVLKSAVLEKPVKIGGGNDREEKSSKRKKTHKKQKMPEMNQNESLNNKKDLPPGKGGGLDDETQVSSSVLRKLFPPPPNLIKETFKPIKFPEKVDASISEEIVKKEDIFANNETIKVESSIDLETKDQTSKDLELNNENPLESLSDNEMIESKTDEKIQLEKETEISSDIKIKTEEIKENKSEEKDKKSKFFKKPKDHKGFKEEKK